MKNLKRLGLVGLLGVGAVFGGCKGMSDDEVAAFGFIGDLAGVSPASSAAEAATGFAVGRAADRESGRREAREGKTEVNVYGGGEENKNYFYLAVSTWDDNNNNGEIEKEEHSSWKYGPIEKVLLGENRSLLLCLGTPDANSPVRYHIFQDGNQIFQDEKFPINPKINRFNKNVSSLDQGYIDLIERKSKNSPGKYTITAKQGNQTCFLDLDILRISNL